MEYLRNKYVKYYQQISKITPAIQIIYCTLITFTEVNYVSVIM